MMSRLVTGPTEEPLSLDQAKLRSGVEWASGDSREALLREFIAAARAKVEVDTELSLLTQTRDIVVDNDGSGRLVLPAGSQPLQTVVSLSLVDAAGFITVVDPGAYSVDVFGRVLLTYRTTSALQLRVIAGWPTPADVPPLLLHAVGLLVAHYMTYGRDLLQVGQSLAITPLGYEDAISAYRPVTLA